MPLFHFERPIIKLTAFAFRNPVKAGMYILALLLLMHLLGVGIYYVQGSTYRNQLEPIQKQALSDIYNAPMLAGTNPAPVDDACRTFKEILFSRTKVPLIPEWNYDQCYYGCQRVLDVNAVPPRQNDSWRCNYNQTRMHFMDSEGSDSLITRYMHTLKNQGWVHKETSGNYNKGNTSLHISKLTKEECSTYNKDTDQNALQLNKMCPRLKNDGHSSVVVLSVAYGKEVKTK